MHTITGCWFASCPSRTWSTTWTHKKSPCCFCIRTNKIHDRSCSDCVTGIKEETNKNKISITIAQVAHRTARSARIKWKSRLIHAPFFTPHHCGVRLMSRFWFYFFLLFERYVWLNSTRPRISFLSMETYSVHEPNRKTNYYIYLSNNVLLTRAHPLNDRTSTKEH